MTSLRWMAFLPLGFVASVVAGAIGNLVIDQYFQSPWLTWTISGVFSGASFLYVGTEVAPTVNGVVKWVLIAIVGLLGAAALVGPLLSGREPERSLAGAAMIVVALSFTRTRVEEIVEIIDSGRSE